MQNKRFYKDRTKWRVRVIDTETGAVKNHIYNTEEEARAGSKKLERSYKRPVGVPMQQALVEYGQHLGRKGNRARSIDTTIGRIRSLFPDDGLTGEVTPDNAKRAWENYCSAPGSRSGKVPSTDTKVGVLKQSRTFLRWSEGRGWVKRPGLLDGIEIEGKRRRASRSSSRLRTTRAPSWTRHWISRRREIGGALAAAMALVMGMRG